MRTASDLDGLLAVHTDTRSIQISAGPFPKEILLSFLFCLKWINFVFYSLFWVLFTWQQTSKQVRGVEATSSNKQTASKQGATEWQGKRCTHAAQSACWLFCLVGWSAWDWFQCNFSNFSNQKFDWTLRATTGHSYFNVSIPSSTGTTLHSKTTTTRDKFFLKTIFNLKAIIKAIMMKHFI